MSTLLALLVVGQLGGEPAAPQPLRLDVPVARPVAVQLTNRQTAPAPPAEAPPPRLAALDAAPTVPPTPVAAPVAAPPVAPYESAGCTTNGYVAGLYCQANGDCPSCPGGCPSCWAWSGKDDGCLCKLHSTCDLYPHFAYYPKYHGYYYFRPYNYQMIAEHQRFAACIGLDPRMPYSLSVFDRVYANFPEKYPPNHGPIGTALPQGSGLPLLEDLLAEVAAESPTPVPPAPPAPQE